MAPASSYPPIDRGWLRRPTLSAEALRALPLFGSLADGQADEVLNGAREHHAVAGEPIVEQWQVSRDLYVVLDGEVEVTADGTRITTCGPGEFFGELAAVDWGAGFARTRTATVSATQPTRLLALDWMLVNRLMSAAPAFGAQLEQASRAHLARH